MNAAHSVIAEFTLIPPTKYYLTTAVVGLGTTVPAGTAIQYTDGDTIQIAAIPGAGWQFIRWTIAGSTASTANPYSFIIGGNITLTAVFQQIVIPPAQYSLAISVVGQGSTTPPVGSTTRTEGDEIELVATPAAGWQFVQWEEGANTDTSNPMSITMNADRSLVAIFQQIVVPPVQRTLTLIANGQGTIVPGTGSHNYVQDEIVNLAALPAASWKFIEWDQNGVLFSTANPVSVIMDSNKTLTAVFQEVVVPPSYHNVNLVVIGSGAINPASASLTYEHGTRLSIQASPDSGWAFDHWEGSASGSTNPLIIDVLSDLTIAAVFVQKAAISGAGVVAAGMGVVLATILGAFK
jgi:hypothetical protein